MVQLIVVILVGRSLPMSKSHQDAYPRLATPFPALGQVAGGSSHI